MDVAAVWDEVVVSADIGGGDFDFTTAPSATATSMVDVAEAWDDKVVSSPPTGVGEGPLAESGPGRRRVGVGTVAMRVLRDGLWTAIASSFSVCM